MTDDEILAAYRALAEEEGIFCEPSSAAGVAGIVRAGDGRRPSASTAMPTIVCVLTGTGSRTRRRPRP